MRRCSFRASPEATLGRPHFVPYGMKHTPEIGAFLRTLRPETSLVQAVMGQKSAMRRAVGIEDLGEVRRGKVLPLLTVTPETEATPTIATIFSLSAQ